MINTNVPITKLNEISKNTLLEHLGIEITKVGEDFISGVMPVDNRTHQPAGLLHGGASAALIESLGSLGSSLIVDLKKQSIVGIEINTNHIRGVKEGTVYGTAKIVHAGRRTHVWQAEIRDYNNKLVATGRLTVMVIEK
ncbi:PaaI family thioesterase [Crocinitomix algicola]|uniref:PaaI family thioesterase n=1 Tax=Crocinitomix algicola TaxID=1740263 RepID=UPI00082D6EB8|nr:hotdog fold thioesterase [Crocinitomix algicola]